jgi:regulator of sigma E protease
MSLAGLGSGIGGVVGLFLILIPLVLLHELGHFIMARLARIRVLEFGLGFPPRARILGHDHETEYTLNYLPIGGFVRLEGEETDSDDPRAFTNSSLPKQLIVLAAGVGMNLLVAVFLFFVVAWAFNPVIQTTIAAVQVDSPAATAGLQAGDSIVSIDGRTYRKPSVLEFSNADFTDSWRQDLLSHAGQTVHIIVADANGTERTVVVTLRVPTAEKAGALGVSMGGSYVTAPGDPVSAAGLAVSGTGRAMNLILGAVGDIGKQLATNPSQAPPGVSGPVGIAAEIAQVVTQPNAFMILLLLGGVISANLALVNVLPLPVLDGGKMVIMVLKRLFGAKGVGAFEAFAYVASFALLLAFMGWITFFDILRVSGQ